MTGLMDIKRPFSVTTFTKSGPLKSQHQNHPDSEDWNLLSWKTNHFKFNIHIACVYA